MSDRYIHRLYRGRPTRGAKLQLVFTVIGHTYEMTHDADPWAREASGIPIYSRRGYHLISRRMKEATP